MIYVVLGIVVLIISFVVALISLVYEQRKVEERKSEQEAEDELAEANTGFEPNYNQAGSAAEGIHSQASSGDFVTHGLSGGMQDKTTVGPLQPSGPSVLQPNLGDQTTSHGDSDDVWWNTLSAGAILDESAKATSDEDKSIQEIREELSKIILSKTGDSVHEPDTVGHDEPSEDTLDDNKQRVLAGEFSLGEIRKQD